MTTLEDDESLERELFTRRERALAATAQVPVPRLEDVLRAAGAAGPAGAPTRTRSNVMPFAAPPSRRPARRTMGAVLLVSACAAALVAIGPQLRQLVVGVPEATILPEPAPRPELLASVPPSAPSASLMPASRSSSQLPSPLPSQVSSSVYSDVCGGEPGTSSDTCSMSCEAEISP